MAVVAGFRGPWLGAKTWTSNGRQRAVCLTVYREKLAAVSGFLLR